MLSCEDSLCSAINTEQHLKNSNKYLNADERIRMDRNLFRLVEKATFKELSDEHRIEFKPVNELWQGKHSVNSIVRRKETCR